MNARRAQRTTCVVNESSPTESDTRNIDQNVSNVRRPSRRLKKLDNIEPPELRRRIKECVFRLLEIEDTKREWQRDGYQRPLPKPVPNTGEYKHTTPHGTTWRVTMRCNHWSPNAVTQMFWHRDGEYQDKTVALGDVTSTEPDWAAADADPDWVPETPIPEHLRQRKEELRAHRGQVWREHQQRHSAA